MMVHVLVGDLGKEEYVVKVNTVLEERERGGREVVESSGML